MGRSDAGSRRTSQAHVLAGDLWPAGVFDQVAFTCLIEDA